MLETGNAVLSAQNFMNVFVLNLRADLSPGLNLKLLPNISNTYPTSWNSNKLLYFGIPGKREYEMTG